MDAEDTISKLLRYNAGHYKPVTFLERGVALGFTTPALLGARIRPAERRGAELILHNPAGVEGYYILPWGALPDICAPTMHDRVLWRRVAELPRLTPSMIRQAMREVALEGHAGRAATHAAREVLDRQRTARTMTQYCLLMELVRQGEPRDSTAPPPERDDPASVQRRARAVLRERRAGGSINPALAFEIMTEMADAFEPCGLRGDPTGARLPKLVADIAKLTEELNAWAGDGITLDQLCSRLLAESAALTLRCARLSLGETHSLVNDVWALTLRWHTDREPIRQLCVRTEWLVDGWDVICGLWNNAKPEDRASVVQEMANIVPVLPAEADSWVGFEADDAMDGKQQGLRQWRRTVKANQDWTTGRVLLATARNELLKERCA
jgi:hypothetical protein